MRPRLSRAEERALVLAARRPDAPEREQLIEAFLPSIGGIARGYRSSGGVERAELMQEGVLGLLRALDRYDAALDTPFWAYASWWVRQAMQQVVSELAWPMVMSDRALRQLSRVKAAQRDLAQVTRRHACTGEVAERTGLAPAQVDRLVAAERRPRALDEPALGDDSGSATLGDLLEDPHAHEAYDGVAEQMAIEQIPTLLAELDDRERSVIRARFGLDGEQRTLRDLGRQLGVSAERVRQIEEASLGKMRAAIAG
jgi:RNA polymerase sigma factor (sigma-70 family)